MFVTYQSTSSSALASSIMLASADKEEHGIWRNLRGSMDTSHGYETQRHIRKASLRSEGQKEHALHFSSSSRGIMLLCSANAAELWSLMP